MGINCSAPIVQDDQVFAASSYGNGGGLARLAAGDSIHASGPVQRTAWSTLSRPPVLVAPFSAATGSTVRRRRAFRPTPLALGNTALASAAAPETAGVAIDVPSAKRYVPPSHVE